MSPRRRRFRGVIALMAMASLFVVGLPWLFTQVMSAGRTVNSVAAAPTRDVALVFGAAVWPSGEPSPYLEARLDLAAQLYRTGKVKVLLVSGAHTEPGYNEPEVMRRYLVSQGVPASQIVEDGAGLDTYDSCVRAEKIFGVDRLLLVSQSYHLPRAVATCRTVGVDAVGVGDDKRARNSTWWYGHARELGANLKMVADLVTRRDPILGAPDDGVRRALAGR